MGEVLPLDDNGKPLPLAKAVTVTIANNGNLSGAIDMRYCIGARIHIPDSWTAARLGFKSSPTLGGTYTIARDEYGNIIAISGIGTTTGSSYTMPIGMFPAMYIKLWSVNTASEADAAQTNAKSITVVLK